MTDTGRVFVVGSLHQDIVMRAPHMPETDETVTGRSVHYAAGGKGANQAVSAALHGAEVSMAGRVGNDAFARQLLAALEHADVDDSQIQYCNGPSGMSVAVVTETGDYGAVIVSGANQNLNVDEVTIPDGTDLVLLQNEIPEAANLHIARAAHHKGTHVILNAAPMRDTSDQMMDLVDILVLNRVEAAGLSGRKIETVADATDVAKALATPKRSVIVTLSADGAVYCGIGGTNRHFPGYEVPVVSTHGAGDAFVGALAARLTVGETMMEAIAYAEAAASLHISCQPEQRQNVTEADVRKMMTNGRPGHDARR